MTTFATRRSLFTFPLAAAAVTLGKKRPFAGCSEPPRMELRASGRRQRGRNVSYCWGTCCIDGVGELYPFRPLYLYFGEVPELHFAELGQVARLHYEIRPSRIVPTNDGFWWKDETSPPIRRGKLIRPVSPVRFTGGLPHGLYVVYCFVTIVRGGSTSQGFRLYVGPETEAELAAPATPATPG